MCSLQLLHDVIDDSVGGKWRVYANGGTSELNGRDHLYKA